MKILILSTNTGEGHNGAARALYKEFISRNIKCDLVDAVSLSGEKTSDTISSIYNSMIVKLPRLFGAVYRAGELCSSTGPKSPVYIANSSQAEKLLDFIKKGGYNAVVCTHLFPMQTMTYLKREKKTDIPCYGVLTDYTPIPFFREVELDISFVPHKDVLAECVRKGMKKNRLAVVGIPVSPEFSSDMTKEEARAQLKIAGDRRVYLVMTGGAGCSYAVQTCKELLSYNDPDADIFLLTGKNKELYNETKAELGKYPNVHIVSFTDKVYLYMKAADLLISKSGGLTTTEAATSRIPIVHINAIPGCETKNAEFFEKNGMSARANSPKEAADLAYTITHDRARCERMLKCQAECIDRDSVKKIADIVIKGRRDSNV